MPMESSCCPLPHERQYDRPVTSLLPSPTSRVCAKDAGLLTPTRPTPRGVVLVVDDETTVRDVVARYLERDGFIVRRTADATAAGPLLALSPDLIVLDIGLPSADGLVVLRDIRRVSEVPVILLSARADETDRVVGLELGADDYVTKPFSPRELSARVRTVLRRTTPHAAARPLNFGSLSIDSTSREVRLAGTVINLRRMEFDLLVFLAGSPRQVFSREQLLERVWGLSGEYSDVSTVTVHVRRIRLKLERDPLRPRWIKTVWGVGYRFEA